MQANQNASQASQERQYLIGPEYGTRRVSLLTPARATGNVRFYGSILMNPLDAHRTNQDLTEQLRSWEGRSESAIDLTTAAAVDRLKALLDLPTSKSSNADELPPLCHWLNFQPRARQSEIGSDGHPKRGGFLPPVPLPRRMWAAGRVEWHAPLLLGEKVQRTSRIVSIKHKSGRTGDLVFVQVHHDISNQTQLALTEEQDIVYRAAAQPGDQPPVAQPRVTEPMWWRNIVPDPVLLFRYSALTFNSHRVHYDRDYATQVEGYPGLVVHGPLIATLLADLARRERPDTRFKSFTFKAVRPLFDIHSFRVCGTPSADGKSAQLWAEDHEGFVAMQAEVRFE